MVERTGGVGGYGAISSDNTAQRTGRYAPHKALSITHDPMAGLTHVRCLICNQRWFHPYKDHFMSPTPGVCKEGAKGDDVAEIGWPSE